MRYRDEIERGFLADGRNFLQLAEKIKVIPEKIAELIPYEHYLKIVIAPYDIKYPFPESVCCKVKGCDSFFG